jgi:hypothetical protein
MKTFESDGEDPLEKFENIGEDPREDLRNSSLEEE